MRNDKFRIGVVNQFYKPVRFGGAEFSVQILCESLVSLGHSVTLFTTFTRSAPHKEFINGVKVCRLRCGNLYSWNGPKPSVLLRTIWHSIDVWNPMTFRYFRSILREEKLDLLQTNNLAGISPSVFGAAESFGIPVVHTLRDYYLLCPRSTMFRAHRNCLTQCLSCELLSFPKRLAARSVSGVIGISDFILRRHQQAGFFCDGPISKVIPNPCSLPLTGEKRHSKKSGLVLGFLGRLEPAKGIELLLRTLTLNDFCGWSKVIVGGRGNENYEKDLRHRYRDSRILYAGYVDSSRFFQGVDLLVVPSLWNEPFGRVVIEAYAHGVPIVASNRGGLSELVIDGTNGLIFNPESADSLRSLLVRLATQSTLLDHLKRGARLKTSNYSPEAVALAYVDLFGRVIDKRRKSSP